MGIGSEEGSRWLNRADVFVKMRRERPLGCAHEPGSILMFVNRVFGFKQFFDFLDCECGRYEVSGITEVAVSLLNTMILKPLQDEL